MSGTVTLLAFRAPCLGCLLLSDSFHAPYHYSFPSPRTVLDHSLPWGLLTDFDSEFMAGAGFSLRAPRAAHEDPRASGPVSPLRLALSAAKNQCFSSDTSGFASRPAAHSQVTLWALGNSLEPCFLPRETTSTPTATSTYCEEPCRTAGVKM